MKSTILFISLILSICSAFAQMRVTEENYVLTLPSISKRLTERQFITISKERFDRPMIYGSVDHLYKIGDDLFSFHKLRASPRFRKPMERQQEIVINLLSSDKEIVIDYHYFLTADHTKIGILKYHINDNCFLSFVTDYNENDTFLTGQIQFKEKDALVAKRYFDEIISDL